MVLTSQQRNYMEASLDVCSDTVILWKKQKVPSIASSEPILWFKITGLGDILCAGSCCGEEVCEALKRLNGIQKRVKELRNEAT